MSLHIDVIELISRNIRFGVSCSAPQVLLGPPPNFQPLHTLNQQLHIQMQIFMMVVVMGRLGCDSISQQGCQVCYCEREIVMGDVVVCCAEYLGH